MMTTTITPQTALSKPVAPHPALTAAPVAESGPVDAQRVLTLQRAAGNRAVGRLLQRANPPVTTVLPAPPPPRPKPRFVAPEPDPPLPWRTDQLIDEPYGPEWVGMRGLGTWTHANWEFFDQLSSADRSRFLSEPLPANVEFEYRIPDPRVPAIYRLRVDAVDWAGETVYEFKPDHLREQGEAEALMYAREMDRLHRLPGGRTWKPCVITYNQDAVIEWAVGVGLFTRQSLGLNPLWSGRLWSYMDGPAMPPSAPPAAGRPASAGVSVPGTGTIGDFMRGTNAIPSGGATKPFTPIQDAAAAEAATGARGVGTGVTALSVVTTVPGIMSTAREMRIESQKPVYLGPAILSDDGGEYTLSWQDGWFSNAYHKTYISGPRAGETVELTWSQWREEQVKRRAKYGYFDWTGRFVEGDVPPVYYSGIPPETI